MEGNARTWFTPKQKAAPRPIWRDSTAPESALPSDCHPDRTTVLEAVRTSPGEIKPRNRRRKKCIMS